MRGPKRSVDLERCEASFKVFPHMRKKGEAETEKGPVDLFPAEPTDEAIYREETLNPNV